MEQIKTTKTKKTQSSDWREVIFSLGTSFVKSFSESLIEKIRNYIKEIIVTLQKSVIGIFLMAIGLIFALIGLVIFVNELFQLGNSIGYILVGMFSILIGFIIIKK